MSGGSLEYLYYRIDDAAERVAEELKAATAPRPPMVVKHDVAAYKPETIAELKNGLTILRVASVYAERMEWLFSGDDGEESFLRRLTEDLEKLKKEGKI